MRCAHCKKPIASGIEAKRMITLWRLADGSAEHRGVGVNPDPPPPGQLEHGWHNRCYWIVKKRTDRGHPVTGRLTGVVPSAYDETAFTRQAAILADRADDPGETGRPESDWREPVSLNVDEIHRA